MKPYENKVYLLDAEKVRDTIEAKVIEYHKQMVSRAKEAAEIFRKWKKDPRYFTRRPCTPYTIRKIYKEWIAREYNFYAKVRVVRIGAKKWVLVYGDVDNTTVKSGTGPFKTLTKAKEWFFKQGR